MKNYLFVCLVLASLVSCKKDDTTGGGNNPSLKHQPNAILPNLEYDGTWKQKGYILMDLKADDNKNKKYMVVDVEPADGGRYKFVLKKGPKPIDSLATNWPANVKSVAFGLSNDIIIDAKMRMQAQGVTPNGLFTYTYDSLHKFPTAILTYNYLNNAVLYAGIMAGKKPDGRCLFWGGDEFGKSKPLDVIYYFKEGYYTNVIGVGNGAQPFTTNVNGVSIVGGSWNEVDAVMTIPGYIYHHFFFDFDKWRYFEYNDFCPSTWGADCTAGIQYLNYKSMDELMTWPEGWGKP
jgi:hypothetical protein